MARAFRLIAEKGPDAFYKGEIASAILKTSEHLGGTMTAQDLAAVSSEWVQPISTDYRGWRVYELPPNSQGMAALEMLNIMEVSPAAVQGPHSPEEMHKRIEAMKLAYADVRRYNADPHTYDAPVKQLLSKDYARKRFALIDPEKANCEVPAGQPVTGDTTYLTVVDRDGNIASWIQSVFAEFGSGITVEGMGFILQNRGGGFTLEAGHPNVLAGGKRPFHTIIPALMERGHEAYRFRHHGRSESTAGARAVCIEHCRLRDERAGRARSPAFHEEELYRMRCLDRIPRARADSAAAIGTRAPDCDSAGIHAGDGTRSGHSA